MKGQRLSSEHACSAPSLPSPQVLAGVCNAHIRQPKPVLISALPVVRESTFPSCEETWGSIVRVRSVGTSLVTEVKLGSSWREGIGGL